MTSDPSGRLYSAVTKHWPKITTGLVVVLGIIELVAGGLTADSGIELYLMAWAGTTGGLWFLFEKAETALSEGSRARVHGWLTTADLRPGIATLPSQFAVLFDELFGERHWSKDCFARSCAASLATVVLIVAVRAGGGSFPPTIGAGASGIPAGAEYVIGAVFFLGALVPFNFVPDYLSLLETRWAIGRMERSGRMGVTLLVDLVLTAIISFFGMILVTGVLVLASEIMTSVYSLVASLGAELYTYEPIRWSRLNPIAATSQWFSYLRGTTESEFVYPVRLAFFSAFFTSVWLWLYAVSVLASRVLLSMNSGVGFLLRVTDVERQPFRSIGFVGVVVVSLLFAAGLPFVLL